MIMKEEKKYHDKKKIIIESTYSTFMGNLYAELAEVEGTVEILLLIKEFKTELEKLNNLSDIKIDLSNDVDKMYEQYRTIVGR